MAPGRHAGGRCRRRRHGGGRASARRLIALALDAPVLPLRAGRRRVGDVVVAPIGTDGDLAAAGAGVLAVAASPGARQLDAGRGSRRRRASPWPAVAARRPSGPACRPWHPAGGESHSSSPPAPPVTPERQRARGRHRRHVDGARRSNCASPGHVRRAGRPTSPRRSLPAPGRCSRHPPARQAAQPCSSRSSPSPCSTSPPGVPPARRAARGRHVRQRLHGTWPSSATPSEASLDTSFGLGLLALAAAATVTWWRAERRPGRPTRPPSRRWSPCRSVWPRSAPGRR